MDKLELIKLVVNRIDEDCVTDLIRLIVESGKSGSEDEVIKHGYQIAVLDKGFVYVGDVSTDKGFVTITDAQNIRWWGTERGLGQLSLEGPTSKTKLDRCGDIKAPLGELKHLMKVKGEKWLK